MKDMKEGYKNFKDVFDWVEKIRKDGLPFCEHGLKTYLMQATVPTDLNATWNLLMGGGHAKLRHFHLILRLKMNAVSDVNHTLMSTTCIGHY